MPEVEVGESTIWRFVRERKIQLTLIHRETFIPQSYVWGGEAQVDWYEAYADTCGEREKAYVFCMRSMASGGAFHCAFPHASQQAFLEAHERAFAYFSGVFKTLRYDNLKSAVKKILRGHQRGRRRESSPSDRTGVSSRSSAHRGKVTRRVGWKERADTFAGTT
jgi:transposase